MNKETIKQKLINELNENSILMYAERQKLKEDHLPKELLEKMLKKHKNTNPFLQNVMLQFMPVLGISYFSASHQNYGKRIFILELLLDWEE